jgi:hydrogenase expression/formation protein HypC
VCLAIPGQVVEVVDELNRLAEVDVVGVQRNVNIGLLEGEDGDGVGPGDWVLIHVGFAISKIDEDEARATRELLEAMEAEYEQELEESVIEQCRRAATTSITASPARTTALPCT